MAEYSQLKNDIFSCSFSDYHIDVQVSVAENGSQDGQIDIKYSGHNEHFFIIEARFEELKNERKILFKLQL
ncbi:MAG: hypothetical protein PSN34_05930 [Urechidicola sp.]|nr:hypothetical protein [Urechidicola sp.]